jgi:hypothetical protein
MHAPFRASLVLAACRLDAGRDAEDRFDGRKIDQVERFLVLISARRRDNDTLDDRRGHGRSLKLASAKNAGVAVNDEPFRTVSDLLVTRREPQRAVAFGLFRARGPS